MKLADVEKLQLLVEVKNWGVHDRLCGKSETAISALTRFLSELNDSERLLVFDLLSDYIIIKDYTLPALDLLQMIRDELKGASICIAPVKDYGAHRAKSADALLYEMTSHTNTNQRFIFSNDPADERYRAPHFPKVVIDDFIGSGDQFFKMINNMRHRNIEPKIDAVATIVIQEQAAARIREAGFKVITLNERPKSLSAVALRLGRTHLEVIEDYLKIESRTDCRPDMSLGFGKSEATVSMKKTPNNTLPIFWYEGAKKWPAPFPRPRS